MCPIKNTELRAIGKQSGILMIRAMGALTLMAIMALQLRSHWQRDHIRELEQELLFRGRQYVTAINAYIQANPGRHPDSLQDLYDKKFIRQLYPDPMTDHGEWYLVMRPGTPENKTLQIISSAQLSGFLSHSQLVGVCSTCTDEAMLEYSEKQRYSEWAFFVGDDPAKKMPELEYHIDPP